MFSKTTFLYSVSKSEFRNDRMKWLELPEWHGMIPKHLPKFQFQEIMNSWRYRLLHYTNTVRRLSENSFLVHLMSTLFSFFYWNRLGTRLMTEKTPGPGYRCKMESRVCDFGSQKWKISFNLIIPLLWSFRIHQIIIEHGTDRLIKHMNQSNGVTSNSSWNGTVPLEHL